MAKENIPRWMTQPTPSVGSATNQLRVVTPDDLQMASQMYGQVSNRFFNIAEYMGGQLNFIRSDHHRIMEMEGIMKAREQIDALMTDQETVNDDNKFKKAISDIADSNSKDAGFFVGGRMRYIINNELGLEKRLQISKNKVDIHEQETRLKNKKLLMDNLHEIYMNDKYTSEQKLGLALEQKKTIYNNDYLYSASMHTEADKKIQDLKYTQDYMDGKIDNILDKAKVDHEYLDAVLNRHDAVQKAEKLSMTFQQSKIHAEAKNRADGYNYYQKNRELLDKPQRDDLDRYFNMRRGKSVSKQAWKAYWSSENLLNKTHQDLVVASRGDGGMMQFLVNERDRQRRQSEDNRDLITKFNTTMGLPDVDKVKDVSNEHLSLVKKYGVNYKEKIHALQNRIIADRSELLQDPKNAKNVRETKMIYEEKKLPALLNTMKEELRTMDLEVSKKRNSLVEGQKKLKR